MGCVLLMAKFIKGGDTMFLEFKDDNFGTDSQGDTKRLCYGCEQICFLACTGCEGCQGTCSGVARK